MKKNVCLLMIVLFAIPGFTQRLRIGPYHDNTKYKEHFTHSIDYGVISDATYIFVAGNYTDKGYENIEGTAHKFFQFNLLANKKGGTTPASDRLLLTDFVVQHAGGYRYAAATGVYYPEGSGDDGYPFLLIYNKSDLVVQSFQYFDLSYAGVETSHGTGLRVQYSGEEEAFYICGVLADRKFNEINPNDIDVKSKGFILKVPESGALSYDALIFTPDQVQNDAWLCSISDIEINAAETEIAFTGLNTLDELTNYHHSMSGVVKPL